MKSIGPVAVALAAALLTTPAAAQGTKVAIGLGVTALLGGVAAVLASGKSNPPAPRGAKGATIGGRSGSLAARASKAMGGCGCVG